MNATTPIAAPDDEIAALRASPAPTLRATAPGMEARLHTPIPVLDHGFVRVVDYMGDDAAIVQAARVSYGAGTKHVQNDEGLIRYLMRHWHSTPFEMCEIKLHVKLPVFVARQWIRHRTANVNEYSARYSVLDREFYIPAPDHLAAQSTTNNQGRGAPSKAPRPSASSTRSAPTPTPPTTITRRCSPRPPPTAPRSRASPANLPA